MEPPNAKYRREISELLDTLRSLGIRDERVLDALQRVPRERFVLPSSAKRAWENHALPLDFGQTISQPYVVAVMTEALHLEGSEHVLEVGTGSGYQAAVLSLLAHDVVTIERIKSLAIQSRELLKELGYDNVEVLVGDGSEGVQELAPWDAIIVTAAGPAIPAELVAQLSPAGGRLVMPVGEAHNQRLLTLQRNGDRVEEFDLGPVAFVPLIGSSGWPDSLDDDA